MTFTVHKIVWYLDPNGVGYWFMTFTKNGYVYGIHFREDELDLLCATVEMGW